MVKTPPSNAGGTGSIPCQGPKILHAERSAAKNLKISKSRANCSYKTLLKRKCGIWNTVMQRGRHTGRRASAVVLVVKNPPASARDRRDPGLGSK